MSNPTEKQTLEDNSEDETANGHDAVENNQSEHCKSEAATQGQNTEEGPHETVLDDAEMVDTPTTLSDASNSLKNSEKRDSEEENQSRSSIQLDSDSEEEGMNQKFRRPSKFERDMDEIFSDRRAPVYFIRARDGTSGIENEEIWKYYLKRKRMASTPLMIDRDDDLPGYEEATCGRKGNNPSMRSSRISFEDEFLKGAASMGPVAYANVSIRLGFIRKVMGILTFQLLMTAAFCVVLYITPNVRGFLQQQPWVILGTLFGSIALLFAMFMYAHTVPLNYFLLTAWTVMQSVTVATAVSFYDVEVVIEATALTALVVICLLVYTLQSKRDFQKYYAAVFCVLLVFVLATFVQIFLQSSAFDFIMAVIGAGIFSVYLVLDMDRVMHHCSPEDYIEACISLYLDIINLFLRILQIVAELNRS